MITCLRQRLLIMYLGLPLDGRPNCVTGWNPTIEILRKSLTGWKSNCRLPVDLLW